MNFKIFLKSLLLISLLSILSCQTQKISFNPKQITELEKTGYKVKFNSQDSNFKNFLVSSLSINSVVKNKKRKTIQINLKDSSQIITGDEMVILLKKKYNIDEIDLLIINNELYDSNMNDLFFEVNSIEKPKIIKVDKLRQEFTHKDWKGDMILLTLKK